MPVWFKLDVHLPSNPKVKRASRMPGVGVNAPMAYMALLAINKMHNFRGKVPADYGAPDELAEWWRMDSAEEMRVGLRSCAHPTVGLVKLHENCIEICGWGPEWDRQEADAAKAKRYREKKKKEKEVSSPEQIQGDGGPSPEEVTVTTVTTVTDESPRHDRTHRTEENRSDQNRGEESTPVVPLPGTAPEPPPPKKSKPKRRTETQELIARHGEQAGELWDLQEMLRASVMPRSRPLKSDEVRLARVCKILDAGTSVEDCEAVLRSYAAEVKRDASSGKHFNGETNWRKANFDRALGGVGTDAPKPTTGRAKPMARESVQETGEQDLRK